jgi:amino acid transporter
MSPAQKNRSERNMFFVTSLIGLLHGLGFSFVLHKILQVDSPNIWQSLLAFNVGVEVGQLMIVLAALPVFCLFQKLSEKIWRAGRISIAAICIVIAAMWVWQWSLLVTGSL